MKRFLEEDEKMAAKGKKKRVYDPEAREAVVGEASRTTIAKAAKQWGIPVGTVAHWHCWRPKCRKRYLRGIAVRVANHNEDMAQ